MTEPNAEYVLDIAARKADGIDCTEEESAVIKRYFDRYATTSAAEQDYLAGLFPLEFAEWFEDTVNGTRPTQIDRSGDNQ